MKLSSLAGLNWYKWGAIALVIAALVIGSYSRGKYVCGMEHAQQEIAKQEEKTRVIVQHVKERVPVIQKDEAEAAALKAQLITLRGKYNEAINARPDVPECALSDDELRYFQEAARATH